MKQKEFLSLGTYRIDEIKTVGLFQEHETLNEARKLIKEIFEEKRTGEEMRY